MNTPYENGRIARLKLAKAEIILSQGGNLEDIGLNSTDIVNAWYSVEEGLMFKPDCNFGFISNCPNSFKQGYYLFNYGLTYAR